MGKKTPEIATRRASLSAVTSTARFDDLFTPRDLQQMTAMGLSPHEAARHVELFRNPPPYTRVLRPCRPGDGLRALPEESYPALLAQYDAAARRGRIGKLVPASGAATRMFQGLLSFLASPAGSGLPEEAGTLFTNLSRFPFYDDLAAALGKDGIDLETAVRRGEHRLILRYLLEDVGLGYAQLPKGLLPFHRYPEGVRTAFEEHLVEAADVARGEDGLCLLHFTVSPQHEKGFEQLLARVRPRLEERHDCRFEVSFSFQRPATDTLAVDPENRPFRQGDGTLLFRPGGHGALIDNLHELGKDGWDIVLLKNVDNVLPDSRKPLAHLWKRLLGGTLLAARERTFGHLDRLEALDGVRGDAAEAVLREACDFLEQEISRPLPEGFHTAASPQEKVSFLKEWLNRPLRVCGVVRNQGEPGGGPFWVESPSGGISPQIVEPPQIDPASPEQQAILKTSSHFNPVDIACALRDRHGRPYDLQRTVDPATVFITEKSHEGRPLKALERPGLWNGAMAGWNTIFVEVPDATFAPVKTVLDLLRPEHQG
ncbi:MAG TPA: DUF4301 family protein [Thermoanaerobaculia bacterium]|nr:DUF4301 family protein [Thermoanaerobaculia bacterium]